MVQTAVLVLRHAVAAFNVLGPGALHGGFYQEVTAAAANSCCGIVRGASTSSQETQLVRTSLQVSPIKRDCRVIPSDSLHEQLTLLGLRIPRKLLERIVDKRLTLSSQLPTAEQLQERMQALYNITQANTEQQQQAVNRRLYHVPELLHYHPDSLADKAAQLQAALQAVDVPPSAVQQLISTQPAVMTFRPDSLASKLIEWRKALDMPNEGICSLWCRQRGMINMAPVSIRPRLKQLADILAVPLAQSPHLISCFPAIVVSDLCTIHKRVAAVQECVRWPPDGRDLGQALLTQGSVLTLNVDTIKWKWEVVSAYAAFHPASSLRLGSLLETYAVLGMFTRPFRNFKLLLHILEVHRQQQELEQSLVRRDPQLGSECMFTNKQESAAELQAHPEMPLVTVVLNLNRARFAEFVNSRYPEFQERQDAVQTGS